jgi:hypothetical protein
MTLKYNSKLNFCLDVIVYFPPKLNMRAYVLRKRTCFDVSEKALL